MKNADRGCQWRLRSGRRWPVRRRPRIRPLPKYCAPHEADVRACYAPTRQAAAFPTSAPIDCCARDRDSSGSTPDWAGKRGRLQRRIERAMEMADQALETPVLEEVIRAALEPLLNGSGDFPVLHGSGVDEVAGSLQINVCLHSLIAAIAQRVGD